MKKLPKEQRNKLVLVWLITITLVAAWVFVVLKVQLDVKYRAEQRLQKQKDQYTMMTNQLSHAEQLELDAETAGRKLEVLESRMASGDIFSWVVTTLRDFKQAYPVDLPQLSQVTVTPNSLLPEFPYQQARITVAGTAYYHDLGMFITDFENTFPFARITNLDIQPAAGAGEKLSFKMDIFFLVKPDESTGRS